MSSSWGRNIKISIFGESHGAGIGVVVDGLPPNVVIDKSQIIEFMQRRSPGGASYSTPRKEADTVDILSGYYMGKTTGTPLCGFIKNTNTISKHYESMPMRPSHGDYTGKVRYLGANDPRGGGHFSARLTAPLVFAGAVASQILANIGITVGGHIASVGSITDDNFNSLEISMEQLSEIKKRAFPVINEAKGKLMIREIEKARLSQDSIGGVVSCCAVGVPAGIGSPMFSGVENILSSIIWGIPAVRGVEFGLGFAASQMLGSQHNDPFTMENKEVKTATNNHGGIMGGITSGMPILLQVAFKPTPSISQIQKTIDFDKKENVNIEIKGRHDPCVVPRAVPCVEACVSIGLLDCILEGGNPIVARDLSKRN